MNALLIGNADRSLDLIGSAQLYPFFRYRGQLRRQLGLEFTHVQSASITEVERASEEIGDDVDVLFVRPHWRDDPDDVIGAMRALRAQRPRRPIFFIDPWDQVSSRFFGVLPYVTKLLKYQRLKDVSGYHKDLAGGTMITDYLVRERGMDLHDWGVHSAVPEGYEDRIATGWNVVVSAKFEQMLFKPLWWRLRERRFFQKAKTVDVCCHVSYNTIKDNGSWYTEYRKWAVEEVRKLGSRHQLAVSGEYPEKRTVSSAQYRDDLDRARIIVSPFGWGETTWRDYEAVCCDCLLLKPDMSHIDTAPHIYRPGETYVPLKWDFSDLQEKVDHYLALPDEAARIVASARRTQQGYFTHHQFVATIGDLLRGVKTAAPTTARPKADALIEEAEAALA